MSKPTKIFLALIVIIGLTTAAAFYLSSSQTETVADVTPVPTQSEAPTEDDSIMEINPENAPFNSEGNEELKKSARFGFITSIESVADTDTINIKFDEALFLTEESAKEQNIDLGCDKNNPPAGCESLKNNGFYIYNPIPKLFTFSPTADATFKLIDMDRPGGVGIKTVTTSELIDYIDSYNRYPGNPDLLFWIVEKDGLISQIEQQYIP